MIIHVTAFAILSYSFNYDLGLEGTGTSNRTGYLHALSGLSSPVVAANDSTLFKGSNLAKLCSTLGFQKTLPLHKLVRRTHAASENVYQVDNCTTCYDLYLECNRLPYRFDPSGDLRVFFESEWSAMCLKFKFKRRTAEIYCRLLELPDKNVTVFRGTKGDYQKSYELSSPCSRSVCRLQLLESDCRHKAFAAVACSKIVRQFRLVEGSGINSGTVQMATPYDGWKYLSSKGMSIEDVTVICRALGFQSSTGNFYHRTLAGVSRLYLHSLRCLGNESRVENCPGYRGTGYDYKRYFLDISCTSPSERELRVTGGYDKVSGRLEVYHGNKWGTICKRYFGPNEVKAACSTITNGRIKTGRILQSNDSYSRLDVWLDGVSCPTETTDFNACTHKPWGEANCEIPDVVYIQCEEELQLRLIGPDQYIQTLQVFHNGEWGTICGDSFGENEAKTACNTLGLPSQLAELRFGSSFDRNSRVWLGRIDCDTVKSNLNECGALNWGKSGSSCGSMVILLSCPAPPDASNTAYRLEGRDANNIGVAEVQFQGIWGRVCVTHQNNRLAQVMCRSLGLSTEYAITLESDENTAYGVTIWLADIVCKGNEANLFECQYDKLEVPLDQCYAQQMLAVACPSNAPADNYPLRLAGEGADDEAGRVEIMVHGIWGRVCPAGSTIDDNIKVMCRQLGVEPTESTTKLKADMFGETTGMASWSVSARCNGMESDLTDCNQFDVSPGSCSDYSDLSIRCDFVRTSLVGPLVGGLVGGLSLIFFGPIVWMLISSRCNKKKYPVPETGGSRAPVGKPVDRLGGNLISPIQPSAPVDPQPLSLLNDPLQNASRHPSAPVHPRPFRLLNDPLQNASRHTPSYTVSQNNYEMQPMTSRQTAYIVPGNPHNMDMQPNTLPPIYDTPPSITSDPPPDYDALFPTGHQQTGMYSSDA